MYRVLLLAALAALLQGCATRFELPESGGAEGVALRFQDSSVTLARDDRPLQPDSLQAGDIILTSAPTLRSASIRLMTWAPVSHAALYVGNGMVVEAVGSGVRARSLEELLEEESLALVLRFPGLDSEQQRDIGEYALQKTGARFSFVGVTLHVPYSVTRRVCELPLLPAGLREGCLRSVGVLNYAAATESRLFCSQLVMQAYRRAGAPITDADARLISPADILHMREGDVSSVSVVQPLRYVGRLKDAGPVAALAAID
jgi:uncharacterized protein YycO